MKSDRWMLWVLVLVAVATGLAIHHGIQVGKEDEVRELFEKIAMGMDLEEVENILGPGMEVIAIDAWGAKVVWQKNGFELRIQVDEKAKVCDKILRSPHEPRPRENGMKKSLASLRTQEHSTVETTRSGIAKF